MANNYIQLLIMHEYQNLKMAEASNWDGVAYIGKRKHISLLSKIDQLKQPGIYFLIGANNQTVDKTLYIGETENIANRFQTHSCDKKKDLFEDFIVFTSKRGDLKKAHVKYLEAVFIELAQENLTTINLDNSCNSNTKKDGKLQSFDLAKADGFKEKIIFVLNNLGLIDFINTGKKEEITEKSSKNIFYLHLKRNNKDKVAKLISIDNGYVLLKDSYIEKEIAKCYPKVPTYKQRQEIVSSNKVKEFEDVFQTLEDIYFKSPSAASDIVKGGSTNGRIEWKLSDGTTLNAFESNDIK